MLTKFDELTDILTDAGKDDFFQATYSDDQIPTSSELAEGLSTNVPASSRIPTVIWKIRIPNVHYKSVNELHYVPSNEGKIRRDGYLLSYFWRAPSDEYIFRFLRQIFLPMTDVSMQKWNNSL